MSTEWEGDEARKPLLVAGNHIDSSIWVVVASTTIAVCGSFVFGISVGYSSPSQEGIMRDLNLSIAEYSVFGSILTIGAMLGAILSGTVADRVGRRGAMAISDVFCILGYLLIVFSKDFVLLYLGRFSTGCGIGLLSYVVPVYISEITPKNLRGRFAAANQLMVCFGASFAYALGTFITWRTMAIIGVTPCLLQLVGLLMIPESPRWLAKTGHPRAFEEALQKLRGEEADIAKEAAEIKDFTEKLHHLPQSKILDLFHKDYINAVTSRQKRSKPGDKTMDALPPHTIAVLRAGPNWASRATRPLHLGAVGAARRHTPTGPLRFRPIGWGRRRTTTLVAAVAAKGSAAAEVVREFYEGVNRRDLAAVAPLIAEGCVYEDLVFPRPMVGRDAVVGFFGEFMGSVSADLRFVIDDISGEDASAVGVTWHLEWKGRPFPFSRGCSFYRCQPDSGIQIVYGRDCVEPATKPGELALVAIRGVTWLLERFPSLADRL